jgi:hypothetical protein
MKMLGRGSAGRRGPAACLTAALAVALTAGLALITAGCTDTRASGGPQAGMSGMPGMSAMPGMTGGMGDMPGMGEVTSAPTTPALAAAAPTGTGLSAALHGYSFVPSERTVDAGSPATYAFRITGPDGRPVTRYQPYESAFVLCYIIRSDLTQFHALQPAMREDGTWSVGLPALPAGSYRTFVTFAAPDSSQGTPLVYQLSSPFTVPGPSAAPSAPVPPAPVASTTVDGYAVSMSGTARAGVSGPLTVVVAKGGKPVVSFQRYLDAYVHLTAFHAGDLAFAQILSLGGIQARTGASSAEALFPESGTWQVYVQFDLGGSVHTAALTLAVR